MHRAEEITPLTITPGAKKIFQAIYRSQNKPHQKNDDSVGKLQVSDVISKMAFYYEKIRNAVHYNEEHLLRKDAIERIFKRQLIIENPIKFSKGDSHAAAHHLLMELIRAGYLPNNTLPETKVDEIAVVIEKYINLRRACLEQNVSSFNFFSPKTKDKKFDGRLEITNWLVGLAAAEIEKHIDADEVSETIIAVMYSLLEKRLALPDSLPYQEDLPIQLYLAIHRRLLKFDDAMLSLILLNYFKGDWATANQATISQVAKNLNSLKELIDKQLNHPLADQMVTIVSSYTVFFNILKDVVAEDPVAVYDEFFDDPKAFARRIKKVCAKRYASAKTKLWRAAWRSIIYILLTKSIFAVILEVPASKFFGSTISPISLTINVVFPALLLFLAVAVTALPGEENTKKIISGIEEIVFVEKKHEDVISIRKPLGRRRVMNFIFGFFYAITFFISFGLIVWLLEAINFSWVSVIIFLFFLTFVSFFTIRIRRGAKEWVVVQSRDSFLRFLLDFFATPIMATGKWLSGKFSQINVFIFILDFIIEAPFKIFVDIAEEWTKYVRERKARL